MYLQHIPTAPPGYIVASSMIQATDVEIDNGQMVAISLFKNRDVSIGDDIQYMKVLYKVKAVNQFNSRTQIIADEAK